jgi:hypothetical protein
MMHKIDKRSELCSMAHCDEEETVQHFLLDCPAYAQARETVTLALTASCTCSSDDESSNCAAFFGDLDGEGQALFMMGGPVNGRTPEAAIDAASRAYVDFAWKRRCMRLEASSAAPLVTNLTAPRIIAQQRALTNYFTKPQAGNSSGSTDVRSPHARTHARAHARSLWNNNGSAVDDSESGFNGSTATKSD